MRPPTPAIQATEEGASHAEGSGPADPIDVAQRAARHVDRASELVPCTGTFAFSAPASDAAELVSVIEADRDGVVLARKSGRCRLRFESATLSTTRLQAPPAGAQPEDTAPSPTDHLSGGVSTSDLADIITSEEERRFTLRTEKLLPIFERGGTAVSDLKLRPTQDGVVLESPPGLYGFLGIAQGDTIVSANEEPVHDSADLMASFMELQRGRSMIVRIRREGAAQELRYTAR